MEKLALKPSPKQVEKMLQHLMYVEGGHESVGVTTNVGHQLGELFSKPKRERDEEKRKIYVLFAEGCFQVTCARISMIGHEY